MLRDTLVAFIDLQDDLQVVAQCAAGDAILPAAVRERPDVAVVDIDLPGIDGLTAAAMLHQARPSCRVLILTAFAKPGNMRRALACGVSGFLAKDTPAGDLMQAIRRVARGDHVFDPDLTLATLRGRENPLTAREADVLRCFARGDSPRDIARQLSLSYGTVRNYLASATVKLDARNRVDAIRLAVEMGWL